MKLALSLLIFVLVWLLVAVWDAATLAWSPQTLLYFIDVPQFLYVLLPALGVTAVVHSGRATASGFALALGLARGDEGEAAGKEALVKGARAVQFYGQVALWSGVVVTLIEAVISAHNAVSLAGFLPALGVSALGVFYGLLIRVVCGLGVQLIKVRLGPFVYYSE
jgi:hypothetical protein